jgi:hypothetical protein
MGAKGSGPRKKIADGTTNPWAKPGGLLPETVEGLSEAEQVIYAGIRERVCMLPFGGAADLDLVIAMVKATRLRNEADALIQKLPGRDRYVECGTGTRKPHPVLDTFRSLNNDVAEIAQKLGMSPRVRMITRLPIDQQLEAAAGQMDPNAKKDDPKLAVLKLVQGGGA